MTQDNPAPNRKLKILMICELYNPELEFQENILVRYYRKFGHEVRVLASTFTDVFDFYADKHDSSVPASQFTDRGAEVFLLPFKYNLLNKVRALKGVSPLVEEFKPDLIFVHSISPNIPELTRYMDQNKGCRMILDFHGDYSNSGNKFGWVSHKILHGTIRKYFLDKALPYLSKVFVIVPRGFKYMREIYKVPDEKLELLPLGADLDLIHRVQADTNPAELRAELGVGDDELLIVTGGKMSPRKRAHLLYEALAQSEMRNVKVVVVGDFPPENSEYKKQVLVAMELVSDRVVFAGWKSTEDLIRYMTAADLAVFPASQSIMWQQSIACGLPLLCGNRAEQDVSYLNCYDNCVILPNEEISAENLMIHIDRFARDPALLVPMAEGARKTADELLNWDRLIDKTTRFCD